MSIKKIFDFLNINFGIQEMSVRKVVDFNSNWSDMIFFTLEKKMLWKLRILKVVAKILHEASTVISWQI